MDRVFLTTMSESFCNDFSLHKQDIWNNREQAVFELNQYLITFMTELRFEDVTLYQQLHEMHKQQQYEITYVLLEQFINNQYPDNNIFNDVVELNEFVIEIPGIAALATGFIASATLTMFFTTLARIFRGIFNKGITKIVIAYFKLIKIIYDSASKTTAKSRAINAIIYTNLDKCGKRCRIGENTGETKLSKYIEHPMTDHRSLKKKGIVGQVTGLFKTTTIVDLSAQEQFKCLLKCFIYFNIDLGNALFNQYNACMNNSVDRNLILYMNQPESNSQCSAIYNIMVEQFNSFKLIINAIPIFDESEKSLLITAFISGRDALRGIKYLN